MNDINEIHIDMALIPEYVKENLAVSTLELIQNIKRKYSDKLKTYVDDLSGKSK